MTQDCPSCGTTIPASNRFCTNCGHSFDPQSSTPTVDTGIPPYAKKVCIGCRTINEPTSAYCYKCGLKLPDQVYSQAEVIGSPGGFWIRFVAYVIDEVLLTIAGVLLTIAFTGMDTEQALSELVGESGGWTATLITVGFGAAYYTFTIGQWGQTIGKAILGLKVARTDGARLTYLRSFARYWAYLVSIIPLGLGFIAIALSSQKRGWHDFICDTRVVNLRS